MIAAYPSPPGPSSHKAADLPVSYCGQMTGHMCKGASLPCLQAPELIASSGEF